MGRSGFKIFYFNLPAVDQIQNLYESSVFLIAGFECRVFSLLVRKIVNFVSTLYIFLRWFASTRETKGPFTTFGAGPSYFLRIYFVKTLVKIETNDLLLIETKSHGHCIVPLRRNNLYLCNFLGTMVELAPGAIRILVVYSKRQTY